MIYCIGLKSKYDAHLDSGKPMFKRGRGFHDYSFYQGGSVWETEEEARRFLVDNAIEGRDVYGVLADWGADTEQLRNEPFRRLVKSSPVVRLGHEPSAIDV